MTLFCCDRVDLLLHRVVAAAKFVADTAAAAIANNISISIIIDVIFLLLLLHGGTVIFSFANRFDLNADCFSLVMSRRE